MYYDAKYFVSDAKFNKKVLHLHRNVLKRLKPIDK